MENYNFTIKRIHKETSRDLTNLSLSKQIKDQKSKLVNNKKIKAKNLTKKELKITEQFGKKNMQKNHGRKGHVGNEYRSRGKLLKSNRGNLISVL